MSKKIILMSWLILALAFVAWAGVGYAAYAILDTAQLRANDTKLALTKANQAALNERTRSLADATKNSSDQLAQVANADVVSIVDTIDQAGKAAGLDAKVSNAALAQSQPVSKDGPQLHAVLFIVQGSGTFEQVMHAAKLYAHLPLLSSLDQMDIESARSSDPHAVPWQINAIIKVITSAPVSI